MALITDPDSLNQGLSTSVPDAVFATGIGADIGIDSAGSNLPALAVGEFFEVRDHSVAGNNGLYKVVTVNTSTSSYECDKVTGIAPVTASSEAITTLGATGASNEKSVHFDTDALVIYLILQGNLDSNGVTMLAFHSFAKEEWKSDNFLIAAAAFPMVGISFAAGQWQFGTDPSGNNSGWKPAEDDATFDINTRRLFRNAGWDEIDSSGVTLRKYFNVSTLGSFEDTVNDQAHYRFGTDATDLSAAVDFIYAGSPVNEPVLYFREFGNPAGCDFATTNTITRSSGSFVTDGYQVGGQVNVRAATNSANNGQHVLTDVTATTLTVSGTPFTTGADSAAQLAVDNDNAFTTYIRVRDSDTNGKTYGQANLSDAGETVITSKIIKFGLSNATDTNISETDANIAANSPYTEVRLRYLSATYNREVDSSTKRNFGIVVDVGTYSRDNGASNGSTLFTSANHVLGSGEALSDYTDGTLIIHEGTDQGTHTISGTPVDNAGTLEITLTAALTGTESNLSFTMQRATPVTASKKQIFEKVQYQLRQAADIDDTNNVVNGRTADGLMAFVGSDLIVGSTDNGVSFPTNPNGGGSGVIIEGFDSNDTNNLFFYDNGGVKRNFPFVAAGTLTFNQNLVDDSDGEYWLYFEYTTRTTVSDAAVVGPSGDTYDLESPGSNLPALSVNDYIYISGFSDSASNGLFIVTVVNVSTSDYTVRKIDGTNVGAAESGVSITVDQNPYPSPQAIIVDDNSGTDIVGAINALTASFDFDYDNNVQGGRTAGTDAAVVLIAAGLETGQVAVTKSLTITRATGLSFSVTSSLERNYSNP